MGPRTALTPQDKTTALKWFINGRDLEFVATALDRHPGAVHEFAKAHGYPDKQVMTKHLRRLEPATQTPLTAPPARMPVGRAGSSTGTRPTAPPSRVTITEPATTTPNPPPPPTPQPAPGSIDHLLTQATTPRAVRLAERIRTTANTLRTQISLDITAVEQAAAAEKERTTALARVARLEKELAAAKQAAAKAKGTGRAPRDMGPSAAAHGVDPRTVRTWARNTGMACPARGRIPRTVIDAYLTDQGGAA